MNEDEREDFKVYFKTKNKDEWQLFASAYKIEDAREILADIRLVHPTWRTRITRVVSAERVVEECPPKNG